MNRLESFNIAIPDGKRDDCAKFTINDADSTFTLNNIASVDQVYTLHFWVKSDAAGAIDILGNSIQTSTEWSDVVIRFKATDPNLIYYFKSFGVYYIYHSKLETGSMPTDWTPAPEDLQESINDVQSSADDANNKIDQALPDIEYARSEIEILNSSIRSLVTDKNGGSLMTQTSNGWTFNIGAIQNNVDDALDGVEEVKGDISGVKELADKTKELADDIAKKTAYFNMSQDENGDPVLELGKVGGEFRLRITNTSMDFMQGSQRIAYLSNRQLYIQSSVVTDEMKIGATAGFIWKRRGNGNMGLRYVSS